VTGYQKANRSSQLVAQISTKFYTKWLETDRNKDWETDRHAQTNLITNCKSNLYNKRQPNRTI